MQFIEIPSDPAELAEAAKLNPSEQSTLGNVNKRPREADTRERYQPDDSFTKEDGDFQPDFEGHPGSGVEGIGRKRNRRAAATANKRGYGGGEIDEEAFERALRAQEEAAAADALKREAQHAQKMKQKEEEELALINMEYEIEKIVGVRKGPDGLFFYQIKWKGWENPEDLTWEPEEELHDELVTDFKRDFEHLIEIAQAADPAPLPAPLVPAPAAKAPAETPAATEAAPESLPLI